MNSWEVSNLGHEVKSVVLKTIFRRVDLILLILTAPLAAVLGAPIPGRQRELELARGAFAALGPVV
jgi:hypothetical protein